MQTENVSNNNHKQFYVLLNTNQINQIKLDAYHDLLKENPLLIKFLNSESTAYSLDETFYHTNILLFSTTISAAIFIKAIKYSTYYIIHNSYDIATKYSIISPEKCKVILPGWQYWEQQCIFPHDLLVAKILKTSTIESYIYRPCYKT